MFPAAAAGWPRELRDPSQEESAPHIDRKPESSFHVHHSHEYEAAAVLRHSAEILVPTAVLHDEFERGPMAPILVVVEQIFERGTEAGFDVPIGDAGNSRFIRHARVRDEM